MSKTLAEIADIIGGRLAGDGQVVIERLNRLEAAGKDELAFAIPPYLEAAQDAKASALLVPEDAGSYPFPVIYVEDPKAAFAKLLGIFHRGLKLPEGVSPKAHIGKNVALGKGVRVLPFAVIDDYAEIGDGVIIYPHSYIGQYAKIGASTVIYPSVTVREHCIVGARCVLHSNAEIGSDGFGFTSADGVHTKVPQVGNVVIEDDVEIGSQVGIDRAAMGTTVIGKGTKIDNLVHIGHNCEIGAHCLIVAQTGISGSTIVGDHVTFGGQVGTVGHIKIGGNSVYAARSGIISDMPEGVFCSGFPVQPHKDWLRVQAAMKRLPELMKKVKELEKKLDQK